MAPKKPVTTVPSKRQIATPQKMVVTKAVKSKVPPVSLPIKSTTQRKSGNSLGRDASSLVAQKTIAQIPCLLQDFVKIDHSVNFTSASSHHSRDVTHEQNEQAEKLVRDFSERRVALDTAQADVEHAKAELERAQSRLKERQAALDAAKLGFESFAGLAGEVKLIKLRRELAKQAGLRPAATTKHSQLPSAHSFEYRKSTEAGPAHHSLQVSFRQLDKSPGSKDWKVLADLVDPQKLSNLQLQDFPYDTEAEIGPASGASLSESLLSPASILSKIESLEEEAFAYIESTVSFKHGASTEPEVLIERRQQFRAYIELEKDTCEGPFKRVRAWLKDRQELKRNVAALFVRRNEARHAKPHNSAAGAPDNSFLFNGFGVLHLRDDDEADGEMVSLQVKRDYSGKVPV